MFNDQIRREINQARQNSTEDGERDIWGLIKEIAYFRHIGDVNVNGRTTRSAKENWSLAKEKFYQWAVAQNNEDPFNLLSRTVHVCIHHLAKRESDGELTLEGVGRESQDHYWHKARGLLATRVLDYMPPNPL